MWVISTNSLWCHAKKSKVDNVPCLKTNMQISERDLSLIPFSLGSVDSFCLLCSLKNSFCSPGDHIDQILVKMDFQWALCHVLDSQALDFETLNSYTFSIQVRENLKNLRFPADNVNSAITAAQVNIAQKICSPQHQIQLISTDWETLVNVLQSFWRKQPCQYLLLI